MEGSQDYWLEQGPLWKEVNEGTQKGEDKVIVVVKYILLPIELRTRNNILKLTGRYFLPDGPSCPFLIKDLQDVGLGRIIIDLEMFEELENKQQTAGVR
jgi:hypothetical protein